MVLIIINMPIRRMAFKYLKHDSICVYKTQRKGWYLSGPVYISRNLTSIFHIIASVVCVCVINTSNEIISLLNIVSSPWANLDNPGAIGVIRHLTRQSGHFILLKKLGR